MWEGPVAYHMFIQDDVKFGWFAYRKMMYVQYDKTFNWGIAGKVPLLA